MKIALVGGGGFRAPMVYDALRGASFARSVEQLALHDVDAARLDRIASVLRGLDAEKPGQALAVRTTTRLAEALEGASFVLCAIRVGGLEGRVVDERVALDAGVLGQETTGPAGLAFAFRTVPVMLEIAEEAAERAPDAWFVNLTNPAGLVTEAIQAVLGDRAVGICDAPAGLCARVAASLGRRVDELDFDYVGLNHLGWLNRVLPPGGADLLPELLADDRRVAGIHEVRLVGIDRVREEGAIPNEYVVYHERAAAITEALRPRSRGEELFEQQGRFYGATDPGEVLEAWRAARDLRHETYMAEGWTTSPSPPTGGSGEGTEDGYPAVAVHLITALSGGASRGPLVLDVASRGALPWLDGKAVVEVPCDVGPGGILPRHPGPVAEAQRDAIERMKEVERVTIRAALERSAALAVRAIALHPLVPSRDVAERIWAGYLGGHRWLREGFR